MSYDEYKDDFDRVQKEENPATAPYAMLVMDVVDSKKHPYDPYALSNVADEVARLFSVTGALFAPPVDDDPHVRSLYGNAASSVFALGDFRGTVLDSRKVLDICWYERNCSPQELAAFVVAQAKRKVGFDGLLHVDLGFFETWKWAEGGELFPFAYCVKLLEDRSKESGFIV